MNTAEQIKLFQEFIETNYLAILQKNLRKSLYYLVIDFTELSKFNPKLADLMLDQPEDLIKAAELAIEQFDLPKAAKDVKIRVSNLPESQKIMVRNIRSEHINKFLVLEGVVRQKSDVRPQVTSARFECPSCGNIISVLQVDKKFKEPATCGCGRKGKFRLIGKELIDVQGIVLEESPEDLEGGEQPKRMNIFLKEDLVSPISDKKTNPGSRIQVSGIIKEVPITLHSGVQSTRFDLLVEANHVETMQEDYLELEINEKEVEQIRKLSNDPKVYSKLIKSVAPSIFGYGKVKEALLLQLVGGVKKERPDGMITRGDMHVLLIGDPGAGKSQLLKRASTVAPKARYVSGKGVSGAGLTAAVVKDEFLKGWALEAGALVLANRGLVCIDEMDKMTPEDRAAMHEALEQQTVSISKANIQATLRCETTVLAAANPKFGRFDPYDIIAKQINLPPALINRFDLIFPVKDLPDEKKDERMAKHILLLHQKPEDIHPDIDTTLLKKYVAYARQTCFPVLTDGAIEEIKNYYLKMRASGSEEGGIKSVPISPRQLEALIRLAEGTAKLRLAKKVGKKDAKRATELLNFCLAQVATDMETGKIDIDKISTGIPASQRSKIIVVKDIIADLENKIGKTIPIDDILKEAGERGIEEDKVEDAIEKLKRSGDIFEPKSGFVQRI